MTPTLLLVDDDLINLKFISHCLKNEKYIIYTSNNGAEAWELLNQAPDKFDAVVLDRMMPKMTGMDLLVKMKTHAILKMVPVIFQTGMIHEKDVLEGLQAGVDYYLTKPIHPKILIAVVKTAVTEYAICKSMWKNICNTENALTLMKSGSFEFQIIDEAKALSSLLASLCPEPDKAAIGLWELLINAVEHGNLGITYKEKAHLIETDVWQSEVTRRMILPENAFKKVSVQFENSDNDVRFLIQDQGKGFDWEPFMELCFKRAFDPNGRGIHMARTLSFDQIKYIGEGNCVMAVISKNNTSSHTKK
ncbi:response regulator [Desulfobacterales bacterium HSG16]|nr:response regulator [Desulfobacterales bacterium HSG16]